MEKREDVKEKRKIGGQNGAETEGKEEEEDEKWEGRGNAKDADEHQKVREKREE